MFTIDKSNRKLVEENASIEMCCRIFRNVKLDLPTKEILKLIETKAISKETALVSTELSQEVLGDIDSFTLLERYASLVNPHYAEEWYNRRFQWTSLLYTENEDPEILRRILPYIPHRLLGKLELPVELYLSARVKEIELVSQSEVPAFAVIDEPQFSVCDPTLAFWRETMDLETLRRLHNKSQWSLFDLLSENCIFVQTSLADTVAMLMANVKPLHVIIARGFWDMSNVDEILRKISQNSDPDAMTLILYERVCKIHGDDSSIAHKVKRHLKYTKVLSRDSVLRYFTKDWRPSVPYVHAYIMNATALELDRLIDINYRSGGGIFNAVDVTTPTALRRLCVSALSWIMINEPADTKSILNLLNVIATATHTIPWKGDDARIVNDAIGITSTPEVKLQLILMATYPVEYKQRYT